eukprot:1195145-Prorocentrum_minimum.AAC.6
MTPLDPLPTRSRTPPHPPGPLGCPLAHPGALESSTARRGNNPAVSGRPATSRRQDGGDPRLNRAQSVHAAPRVASARPAMRADTRWSVYRRHSSPEDPGDFPLQVQRLG